MNHKRMNDSVHWFISELTSRIVAKSGKCSDRFHLGKILLQSFEDAPDLIMQIDGATDQSETNFSVQTRSVKCATAFRNIGLQQGDVMVLMAPNHIDLAIPLYAALYLGIAIAPIDRNFTGKELHETFNINKPKVVFCQSDKVNDIQLALSKLDLGFDTRIITFDKESSCYNFCKLLEEYADDTSIQDFKPSNFDPEDTIAFLIPTSGTTGTPKAAAISHKNFMIALPSIWLKTTKFPSPTRMSLVGAPLQWLTAVINFIITPIFRYTRLQSSQTLSQEHACYLINTYKPTFAFLSPTMMTTLIKLGKCDFSCFEDLLLGGSAVPPELVDEIKKITPDTEVTDAFGMTEISGMGFHGDNVPQGSCGKPLGCLFYRLIDIETQKDITTPNVAGELWLKGPSIIKGYYNNPTATEEAFVQGGWFKTGDLFYRDENWNYFFVERIKLMLKYMSYHISPLEIEAVIRQHPGVLDVAVTGIQDPECGDLVVACVVRRQNYTNSVTSQDIKDLVKKSLSDPKQLRGGVIFLNELPMTATTKLHRRKLKEMVINMQRE